MIHNSSNMATLCHAAARVTHFPAHVNEDANVLQTASQSALNREVIFPAGAASESLPPSQRPTTGQRPRGTSLMFLRPFHACRPQLRGPRAATSPVEDGHWPSAKGIGVLFWSRFFFGPSSCVRQSPPPHDGCAERSHHKLYGRPLGVSPLACSSLHQEPRHPNSCALVHSDAQGHELGRWNGGPRGAEGGRGK